MKNNKIWIIGGVILVVILLVASFNIKEENPGEDLSQYSAEVQQIIKNAQAESAAVKEEDKGEFTYINVDEYLELYAAETNSLVLLARPTCTYCEIAEPIIRKIVKIYGLDIKYLNTDEFTAETQAQFVASDELFYEGFGTPLLLVVGNGKITDIVDGLTDNAHYMEFLQDNGFIITE